MSKKNDEGMIFGLHAVAEAADSGREIEKVLIQNGLRGDKVHRLKLALNERNIPIQYVPIEKLNRVTRKNHQGVICFASPVTFQHIEDLLPGIWEKGETPLILILDRVTDVRNFGAIARSAECMGVHAIVIPKRGSASITSDAVKTSAGALHSIPVCREDNLKHTIDYLKESGLQIVGCTEKTDSLLPKLNIDGPLTVIMGSEENGISKEYLDRCDHRAKIPMFGSISSLNVSVAAGMILYEVQRQRNA